MPNPVRNMQDKGPAQKILGVLYGDSGAGKTRSLRTLSNNLIINVEAQGIISLRGEDVTVWDVTRDAVKPIDSMRNAWMFASTSSQFEHVTLDSITEMQMKGLDDIVGDASHDTDQRDYGKNFRQIRALVLSFMKLPQHLWLVAGERSREDDGAPEYIQPDMPPALLRWLKRNATLGMRYTTTRKRDEKGALTLTPTVQTFYDGRSWGIDRSGKLSQHIPNPNLDEIVKTYLSGDSK